MAKGDLRASPDEIGVFLLRLFVLGLLCGAGMAIKKEAMCYGLFGVCAAINR